MSVISQNEPKASFFRTYLKEIDEIYFPRSMKFLTLCIITIISLQLSGQDGVHKHKMAKAYEKDYRYKKAIKLYTEAIEADPLNSVYYLDRALLRLKIDRMDPAKEDLIKTVSLDLQNVKAWQALGDYYLYKGIPDSAIMCINRSLSFDWENRYHYKNLMIRGDAYMLRGSYADAYENYMELVKNDSVNTHILKNIAFSLSHMNRDKECIYYLQKIAKANSGDTEALVNVGYSMTQIGMYTEAMEYFNTVLEYDKDQPYALSNRGFALLKLGSLEEALRDLDRSIKNDPKNVYGYWVRGLVHLERGNSKKACQDFDKAEKFDFYEELKGKIEESKTLSCE